MNSLRNLKPKRILVVGCSGSGKSTLTRKLAAHYKLPPVHLDVHFWQADWVETPKPEWNLKIADLAAQEEWVMDGTFAGSFALRFPRADLVVWLDFPRLVCLKRAILRVFQYNKVNRRPDMAEGCNEQFDFEFYKYIWTFRKKVNPEIEAAFSEYAQKKPLFRVRNDTELCSLMAELGCASGD